MPSISLDEEARLYSTNAEREKHGLLATLFGIVVALDYLERAYVRDSIPAVECVPIPVDVRRGAECMGRGTRRRVRGC